MTTVRRVFFSFHYQRDIWRVMQVRNSDVPQAREAAGFFDGSLEEKAETSGVSEVKRLIDKGLQGTSVTCVLIGSGTHERHWVQYEIFRSIEQAKGILGVRIHNLRDRNKEQDSGGPNIFERMGYGYDQQKKKFVPYVRHYQGWKVHSDANPISGDEVGYLPSSRQSYDLGNLFQLYDWVTHDGYKNFGDWVREAAIQAGR